MLPFTTLSSPTQGKARTWHLDARPRNANLPHPGRRETASLSRSLAHTTRSQNRNCTIHRAQNTKTLDLMSTGRNTGSVLEHSQQTRFGGSFQWCAIYDFHSVKKMHLIEAISPFMLANTNKLRAAWDTGTEVPTTPKDSTASALNRWPDHHDQDLGEEFWIGENESIKNTHTHTHSPTHP